LCDLHPEDWCELIHRNGNPWTLSRMRRRIEQIENKSMRDKPVNRRGCIEETLFDVFEPSDYIPPCLHIMMGAFNDAINGMLSYIDIRHEQLPIREFNARNAYWKAKSTVDKAQKELDDFRTVLNMQLQERKDEIDQLEQLRQLQNPPGFRGRKYVYNQEQKRDMAIQIGFLKEEINNLEKGETIRKDRIDKMKDTTDSALKTYKEMRKQRKAVDSEVRQKIERLLAANGVDRGAHHGGDLTGVACLKLEQNILDFIDGLKDILKSAPGVTDTIRTEVDDQLESYEIHFLLLSRLFSTVRTEKAVFKTNPGRKQEILNDLGTTISLVNQSTKRLGLSMKTVKRHICDDHLVTYINRHEGIAEFQEDWLEQIHQSYKRFVSRAKIRDKATAASFEVRLDSTRNNTFVTAAGKRVFNATKRKFRKDRNNVSASFSQQQARRKRRDEAVTRATALFLEKPALPNAHTLGIEDVQTIVEGE
jgi:hypothetical protein